MLSTLIQCLVVYGPCVEVREGARGERARGGGCGAIDAPSQRLGDRPYSACALLMLPAIGAGRRAAGIAGTDVPRITVAASR